MKTANSSSNKHHKHRRETPDSSYRNEKDTKAMKESLLLPCTSSGKTTSASIAEKSNVWAENRLTERKLALDKKLYRNIVKLNVDRLEVVEELTKLKKSSSTGALDKLVKPKDNQLGDGLASPVTHLSATVLSRRSSTDYSGLEKEKERKQKASDVIDKRKDDAAKISIVIGGASSSDEASDEDKPRQKSAQGKHRTFSLTSCQQGHECSTKRSELQTFENATRRYTHLLSKTTNGK